MHRSLRLIAALLVVVASPILSSVNAESQISGTDIRFFENRIRPVLVKHCYKCHATDSKEVGGKLLLDSRAGLLKGGESGPAVSPENADDSLIIQALKWDGLEMPPEQPLPENVINDFVEWVKRGAPDPRESKEQTAKAKPGDPSQHWSLQPLTQPDLPPVTDAAWPLDSIDRFVLARIEAAKLKPTDIADARTLIRRLHVDLTGLQPSFADIEQFADDYAMDQRSAVENLVDTLLASPQFGERWGRHWLDVARFAESNGNDGLSRNPTFPHAWRYRDYVIQSFNNDVPYNRFLTEQIAGDLLPSESPAERDRLLVATGLLAMASKPAKAMNTNFDMDVVADQIDVIGRGIMGLSVGCARCHDHKFDPVPTNDYYALAGIFTSTETMWGIAGNEKLTAPVTDLHVLKAAPKILPPEGFVETVIVKNSATGIPNPIPKPKWPVGTPLAMGVRDKAKPADCKVNIKGDAKKLGKAIPRGFVTACSSESAAEIKINAKQSGRVQLAEWLTSDHHPLTARVFVNRVWMHLFGKGLVATPDDFGVYGDRPTHPELLDHLASRFMAEGWSTKRLIRSIVLSRSYQLGNNASADLRKADSTNRLLTRHNRRRLDAESLRDSMLQASGQLDLEPADGSIIRHRDILVNLAGNLHQPTNKRSVYQCYLRSSPPPELAAFDLPDFISVTGKRDRSTVPGQALYLFNSPFVIDQAGKFATSIMTDAKDDTDRVRLVFQRSLGRNPQESEVKQALELVRLTKAELKSDEKAWASLCQGMLATSEFRYVD